jgi:vacuolar-type H+-ATPase subunit I/STV1
MNSTTVVVVALTDVLEELGFVDEKLDEAVETISEHISNETEEIPETHESFTSYITDDDLLEEALKKAKVNVKKFKELTDKVSAENHDLPVVISF